MIVVRVEGLSMFTTKALYMFFYEAVRWFEFHTFTFA